MRLFVGIPVTGPALEQVQSVLRRLRDQDWPVRWVKEDGLHVNLKFFGEVTSDRVEAIEDLLRYAAAGIRPLDLVVGRGGAFPTARKPRVLHLDVEAGPELELLQDRLERAGSDIGFAPEGRPFAPHITLGRVREGQRLPREAVSELEAMRSGIPFRADRVILFESRLTPAGPVYRECSAQPLA